MTPLSLEARWLLAQVARAIADAPDAEPLATFDATHATDAQAREAEKRVIRDREELLRRLSGIHRGRA